MKKILYLITQSELGGAQRYVFDLVKNLKDEFEIFVAFGEQGEEGDLAKQLNKIGVKYFVIPHLKRNISLINDWRALKELAGLIKMIKPDIIHLNSSKISILGSLAKLLSIIRDTRYKIRVIYTAHGWVFNEPLPFWQKLFYKASEWITSINKNKIICVSEYDRQVAINSGISEKKLITIHNGIDEIDFLTSPESLRKFRDGQHMIIGSIGNLYKTKGYEYLIEAADILINQEKLPLSFFIIGAGSEQKNLVDLIARYKLDGRVLLPGRMPGAARLLPSFDIYVCSSVKEGLSYTIMEAMSAGLPIVAARVGGNSELIDDNENGLLTPAKNPVELAGKIKSLFANSNLRKELGSKAKKKIEAEFTINKMIEKTRRVYNSLI